MAHNEPTPPDSANDLYRTLFATAYEFVHSHDQDRDQPSRLNLDRVRAIRTTNHTHRFGHNFFVSFQPTFQSAHSLDQFIAHISTILPKLETWDTYITDIVVDETKKMCVVRASYFMKPSAADEPVENDLVWWLWMDEGGRKVEKAMEFIDPTAAGRIKELMMGGNK